MYGLMQHFLLFPPSHYIKRHQHCIQFNICKKFRIEKNRYKIILKLQRKDTNKLYKRINRINK